MTGRLTRPVDGSEAAGMSLVLAVVSAVAETDVMVPRPWTTSAVARSVLDGAGVTWFVDADGATVERMIALDCQCACAELTTFRAGVEIGRCVGRVG
ncbi:hypothetical protein [Yinghuangia soli]|uniref:Uncharacterized protein n=1 Tax=Yinghuangia soli TaxID=2908204 RepID=A0AA41PVP5_9ACTN|nr:hypothetical protein [Yinghuangia soli]MCF2526748.1 hypothetical protein [Yinghuangia soli]